LFDASGQEVGDIVVTKEVTKDKAAIKQLTVILIVICIPVCIGLLAIIKSYIRLIENKLTITYSDLQNAIEKRKLAEEELRQSYSKIEQEVKERTAELQTANEQLTAEIAEHEKAERELSTKMKEIEEFNCLAVGRELKMIELKREINRLLAERGIEQIYEIVE
jgi:C4-dicarboxylate-specific signal transduction histidine kinase